MYIIIAAVVGLTIGFVVTKAMFSKSKKDEEKNANEKAKLILKEAEISAENQRSGASAVGVRYH